MPTAVKGALCPCGMRDGSKSCVQGVQALVGHTYSMNSTPAAPSAVLHTPPLCIPLPLSRSHTCLGSVTASHAPIGCVNAALAVLAHVGCWESVPRDMPANPGVLLH